MTHAHIYGDPRCTCSRCNGQNPAYAPKLTARAGQFRITGRSDLGTLNAVELLQDGQPVALLWRAGTGSDMLPALYKDVRAVLAAVDNYRTALDAWNDAGPHNYSYGAWEGQQ